MKVLVLAETRDVRSGWGRYAYEVTSELERRKIDVELITSRQLRSLSVIGFFKNILFIRSRITKNVTLVHAFDVWPFSVYAYLAGIGKGKPLFITGVGTYSIPPEKGIKSWIMIRALSKAAEIFCISNYTLSLIKSRVTRAHTSLVYWGTTKLPRISEKEVQQYKQFHKIKPIQSPIIITVGQIKHRKGQLDTLRAIRELKLIYPHILYIAIGSTSDHEYVKTMTDYAENNHLNDNFKIINNQKADEELSFFYSISDIFAMNSNNDGDHFEGFGLVFLEAAQFGKPAVGSSNCGIEDAIVDGVTGYLTRQGDSQDIANKIELLLKNRGPMGEKARERAKGITWQKTVDHHLNSYRKYVK
jgi:glycosyltransferase involved in cell wall biosynthesis